MKEAVVNPMRNKKYIEEQFDDIQREKITEWSEKNKEPLPPTSEFQMKEAMDGKIIWKKPQKGCSCSRYSHSRSMNVPDWSELIKTPSQEAYAKEKADHASAKQKISTAVAAERKRRYEAVMFAKEDFLEHAKAFRAFKV